MTEKLVTIAWFANYIEADLAKQLLDDFAIKSVAIGEKYGSPYGIPSQAKLQVFESQTQQALEILESHKKKEQ